MYGRINPVRALRFVNGRDAELAQGADDVSVGARDVRRTIVGFMPPPQSAG